jgi:hypothetical protein
MTCTMGYVALTTQHGLATIASAIECTSSDCSNHYSRWSSIESDTIDIDNSAVFSPTLDIQHHDAIECHHCVEWPAT